jgi:hypothetical protein
MANSRAPDGFGTAGRSSRPVGHGPAVGRQRRGTAQQADQHVRVRPAARAKHVDGLGADSAAQQDRVARRHFEGLIFESLLGDNIVFRSQVGAIHVPENIFPVQCMDHRITCDDGQH